MPYRKKYNYNKYKGGRRNTHYNSSSSGGSKVDRALAAAGTALSIATMLKGLINVERKYKILSNTFSVGTSGQTAGLNSIAQGTDDTERIGRSLKATSWLMRATVQQNPAATSPTTCRMMVLWDRQPAGAPAVLEVMETANPLSSLNKDHGKRFTTLWDRTFTLNDQRPTIDLKAFRKLNPAATSPTTCRMMVL